MLTPTTRKKPEDVIKKAVVEYLKWAYADSGLKVPPGSNRQAVDHLLNAGSSLPLLVIETGPKTTDAEILQNNALNKLGELGEKWRRALWREENNAYLMPLPTLYTIVATNNTVAFAAYDIDACDGDGEPVEPFLRHIHMFDFRYRGQDVWNALDIAMLIIHVRNERCSLTDTIQESLGISESQYMSGDEEMIDPDA